MSRKKLDVMDNILGDLGSDSAASFKELDCLIYKNDSDIKDEAVENNVEKNWQVSKDNVSVQVWESGGRAKIKVKVSQGKKTVSMKKIARIALNAIVEELKKED